MAGLETFESIRSEGTFSARLLSARRHFAKRPASTDMVPLRELLGSTGGSYSIGDEPGSGAYQSNSPLTLVRTGSIEPWLLNVGERNPRVEHVREHAFIDQGIKNGDLLVAKDGSIGQVGMVIADDPTVIMVSSGLVHLRFPVDPWFYFAFLKFGSFTEDIELLTPKGATLRHAGINLLLNVHVPSASCARTRREQVGILAQIASRSEREIQLRSDQIFELIDSMAGTKGLSVLDMTPGVQSFDRVFQSGRIDASFHGALNSDFHHRLVSNPHSSLRQLVDSRGYSLTRGQNLQFTSIGYSLKHEEPRLGSYRLIEPNFVGPDLSVLRTSWLWCPRKLQTLSDGQVIMSAEGSIGNVAVFHDSEGPPTVSNIHALLFDRIGSDRAERNSWLAANLMFLRRKGWFDAISVGGQGGSLAIRYHDAVPILDFDISLGAMVHSLMQGQPKLPTVTELTTSKPDLLRDLARRVSTLPISALGELRLRCESALRELVSPFLVVQSG